MPVFGWCKECFCDVAWSKENMIIIEDDKMLVDCRNENPIYECPECDYPNAIGDFHHIYSRPFDIAGHETVRAEYDKAREKWLQLSDGVSHNVL